MKAEKGKIYAILSAICFLFVAVRGIIPPIRVIAGYGLSIIELYKLSRLVAPDLLDSIVMACLAAAVFMRKEKAAVVFAGIGAVSLAIIIVLLKRDYTEYFFAYAMFAVIIVLAIKKIASVRAIWFIPGAVILLGDMRLLYRAFAAGLLQHFLSALVHNFIIAVGFAFAGLWLKEKTKE